MTFFHRTLIAIVIGLSASFLAGGVLIHAQGTGTISTLDQWTGTTTPDTAITQRTSNKSIKITGLTTGLCLTLNASNILTTTTCGSGGSGGSTWSTTTSQVAGRLINYPNNTTDIVAIGSNATTSAEYWFDPNAGISYLSGNVGIGTAAPTAKLEVVAGTLTDQQNALKITATQPTVTTAQQNAIDLQITSAGSSSQTNVGMQLNYLAGYTGSNPTVAARFVNQAASVGTGAIVTNGNLGGNFQSTATTIGTNLGFFGNAQGGNVNVGAMARAITAKNSATNIGVLGAALNTGTTPIQIGGFFGLMSGDPTFESGALIADNGSQTSPIFLARDNGTKVFVINDGGNVGIGTSTPNNKLDIYSTTKAAIGFSGDSGGTYKWTIGMDVTNGGRFSIASSTALGTTDRFVIAGNGNVGIASSSPVAQLVLGSGGTNATTQTFQIDSGSATGGFNFIKLTRNGSEKAGIVVAGAASQGVVGAIENDLTIRSTQDIFLSANSGVTPHFVVKNSGNVGIGTTSPARTFSLVGNSYFAGTILGTSTVAFTGLTGATGGTNQDVCIVAGTGDLVNETTGSCVVSSRRFKHDIKDLAISGLDALKTLIPRTFKRDGEDIVRYGFIAEEVAETDPHLATYGTDGLPRGLDDHALIAVLTSAMQEMNAKVEKLEVEVARLQKNKNGGVLPNYQLKQCTNYDANNTDRR